MIESLLLYVSVITHMCVSVSIIYSWQLLLLTLVSRGQEGPAAGLAGGGALHCLPASHSIDKSKRFNKPSIPSISESVVSRTNIF